jgi:hypothetical protein
MAASVMGSVFGCFWLITRIDEISILEQWQVRDEGECDECGCMVK